MGIDKAMQGLYRFIYHHNSSNMGNDKTLQSHVQGNYQRNLGRDSLGNDGTIRPNHSINFDRSSHHNRSYCFSNYKKHIHRLRHTA